MTTYNTRNPLGSSDPRDLFDNAQNLDFAINAITRSWIDRFGVARKTIEGAILSMSAAPYQTLAALQADTNPNQGWAIVVGDPTISNNGYYYWTGSAWQKSPFQPPTTQQIDDLIALVNSMPTKILSAFYSYAIADLNGKVALGVQRDTGMIHMNEWRVGGSPLNGEYFLSGEWRWVVLDSERKPVIGIRHDGTFYGIGISGSTSASSVGLLLGKEGAKTGFLESNQQLFQLSGPGNTVAVRAADGQPPRISVLLGSGIADVAAAPFDASKYADFITSVLFVFGYGQSLSMGSTSSVPITSMPPAANRLRSPSYGVRLTNQDDVVTTAVPTIPAKFNVTEVPILQGTTQVVHQGLIPADVGVMVSCNGRGGAAVSALKRGSVFYQNLITTATQTAAEATAAGKGVFGRVIDFIQGEANSGNAAGVYYAEVVELMDQFDVDLNAALGTLGHIPMVIDQISNWTAYNRAESNVPLEQLQLALDSPGRFYCAGPKFWLKSHAADGVHMNSNESAMCGAMHAPYIAAAAQGVQMLPVHVTSATRTGDEVTLQFSLPFGSLVIDTKNVTDPGMLGLRWIDSTNSAQITSVKMIGNNRVLCKLSAVPTGASPRIGIADIGTSGEPQGPTTGPRNCFRSSVTTPAVNAMTGYHFACHQRINVKEV